MHDQNKKFMVHKFSDFWKNPNDAYSTSYLYDPSPNVKSTGVQQIYAYVIYLWSNLYVAFSGLLLHLF